MGVIDYDQIDDWMPWVGDIVLAIGPAGFVERIRTLPAEFMEDARDHVIEAIGLDALIAGMNARLSGYAVRVFHGTRVTPEEAQQIERHGLRALKLVDRKSALTAIFGQHPDWSGKSGALDELLRRFGPNWMKGGGGKREDGCVHACLSRAGLIHGCNHYLAYGAEVDQQIAKMLFQDTHSLDLLRHARTAKIISFSVSFPEAAAAANPLGPPAAALPGLVEKLIEAWAFKQSHPDFRVVTQRDTSALRFPAPIAADQIDGIEDISDHYFQSTYDRDARYG